MIKNMIAILLIGLFSPDLGFAAPAVLIEENPSPGRIQSIEVDGKVVGSSGSGWVKRDKALSESRSLREVYADHEFSTALDLRARRRVGVGFSMAGQTGIGGALIELNFSPANSVVTGFGGGPRYNALALEWKHVFGGRSISPYSTLGYSHWYSSSSKAAPLERTTPGYLGSRFLTSDEKQTGIFAKDFLIPSAGLQFNQLSGPYVGTSIFVEVLFMMEASELSPMPTGSLGMLYYF